MKRKKLEEQEELMRSSLRGLAHESLLMQGYDFQGIFRDPSPELTRFLLETFFPVGRAKDFQSVIIGLGNRSLAFYFRKDRTRDIRIYRGNSGDN